MGERPSERFDRRTILKTSGATAIAALAGCSSSSDDGTPTPTDEDEMTPEPTATEEEMESSVETKSTGDPYADTKTAAAHVEGSAEVLAGGITAGADLEGDSSSEAAGLRATLSGLLQEHVYLAGYAVDAAYSFGPDSGEFDLASDALDTNSVELADVIGEAAGSDNRDAFLSLWRDHIGFFVDYAAATAGDDEQGQAQAIRDLDGYTDSAGGFFEDISGGELPADAVADNLVEHIATLGGAIDSLDAAINQ